MNPEKILSLLGVQKLIEETFATIVKSTAEFSEKWIAEKQILTIGREEVC